jgi:hypothetical protein
VAQDWGGGPSVRALTSGPSEIQPMLEKFWQPHSVRQIEIGDINRLLLHLIDVPRGTDRQPSHTLVDAGLYIGLTTEFENLLISELMGHLSYRSRQPILRVIERIKRKGQGKVDVLGLWQEFGQQLLERRHTLFIKPNTFEQWRRSFHALDEDAPGLVILAAEHAEAPLDLPSAIDQFRLWHTFVTGDDQQLAQELSKGICCQHIHLAASYPAPYFWVALMNMRFSPDDFFSSSAGHPHRIFRYPYLNESARIKRAINHAIIIRYIMFKTMAKRHPSIDDATKALLNGILNDESVEFDYSALYRERDTAPRGTDYTNELIEQYELLDNIVCPTLMGERVVLFAAFHYLSRYRLLRHTEEHGLDEDAVRLVSRALWYYLQVKSVFLGTIQHREGIYGFDYFEHTLQMSSWIGVETQREACAREIGEFLQESSSVIKIEFMSTPADEPSWYNKLFRILRIIQEKMTDRLSKELRRRVGCTRVGVIFHFIKEEGEELHKRLNDDGSAYRIFHCGVRDRTRRQAQILREYLGSESYKKDRRSSARLPDGIPLEICGIDAANRELHCPPEIFGQVYQMFSTLKIGRTFHVGEDFLHLMTGLRRIYEAIKFLGLRAGDRIGHAIALGVSPQLWAHSSPTVSIHKIDILDDAVFEWTLLQEYGSDDSLRLSYLERQVARLSMDIYGAPLDPYLLQTAWLRRAENFLPDWDYDKNVLFNSDKTIPKWVSQQGRVMNALKKATSRTGTHNVIPDISALREVGRAHGIPLEISPSEWPRDTAERVLIEYLYDVHTIGREIEMQVVTTAQDIHHISRIQDILRSIVSSSGLTIESNPSSNWLIGGFERVYDVPAVQWSLKFPDFPLTINPDDPVTFSTSIENEYFYVFSSLLTGTDELKGVSRMQALEQIKRIRTHGIESSFLQ